MSETIQAIRGMSDVLPDEAELWEFFEDTVRDVEVIVGGDVLDALGAPLSLVMDSARWLAARIAEAYTARLGEHFERISTLSDEAEVPLARLLSAAARDFRAPHGAPEPTWDARAELVRRWERILNVPDGVRRHGRSPG